MRQPTRFSPESGIALGPILFVLAILGILTAVLSAGTGSFGIAGTTDRIAADIPTQANLIRAKINECNMMYGTGAQPDGSRQNYDGYPSSGGVSIAVTSVTCSGDATGLTNIWSGARTANLPPPTNGFNSWNYINSNSTGLGGNATKGRCIWIQPSSSNPIGNAGIVAGLTRAAKKFTTSTSNDYASEVNYDATKTNQRFIVWITLPVSPATPTTDCTPQ